MSLRIGAALKEGGYRLVSRTGAILMVSYVALYALYAVAFNDLINALYAEIDLEIEAISPALEAPLWLSGTIVGLCVVLLTYLSVVAVRTFVANERDGFPRDLLADHAVFATLNLLVGGFVLTVLLMVGFVLFVIPGVFLAVTLIFMTMYVAVEDENFVSAMRNSWGLTDGERFSVFFLLLVIFAVLFAVSMGTAIVALVLSIAGASGFGQFLNVLVLGPATMYNLAVLSVAFRQLRGDDEPEATAGAPARSPT